MGGRVGTEVVTLGESMVVFVPETVGPLRHAERFRRGVAGAESNLAIGLSRLGHSAAWIGRLGDDEFGRFVWSTLRGEGVDLRWATLDARAPTGVMFKERRAGGDSRVFYYRRGSAASLLDEGDVPPAAFEGARWLHVAGITPALGAGPERAVRRAMALARAAGTRVSFDPNYRARLWPEDRAAPVLRELAAGVDLLVLGEQEGRLLFGVDDPEGVSAAALAHGCGLVAVKRGAEGALLAREGERVPLPPLPVAAVESTGAGDAFAAGLLAGLLEGMPLGLAGRLARFCGAMATTAPGDWEAAPDRDAARRHLAGSGETLR
jgi:2-dehydro-3-deoxygluconokinase